MLCKNTLKEGEVRFRFLSGEDEDNLNWGLTFNFHDSWREWKVCRVETNGQAAKFGIEIGWQLIKIDNKLLGQHNYDEFKSHILREEPGLLTFQKSSVTYTL